MPAGAELLRPYFGMRRFEWDRTIAVDFHLGYGDWIRVLTSHGFEVERLVELRNPGRGSGPLQPVHAGVGRALAGRGDVEGAARSRERPSRAAAAPRLDLAAAARDPRAARAAVRRRAHRGTRSTIRRTPIPSSSCAPTRRGRRDRSRTRPATAPCSASTRRSSAAGACYGKAVGAGRGGGDARRARRRHARGRLGPLPDHARVGGAAHRDDARDVPPADRPRHRRVRRRPASGRGARAPTRSRASAPPSSSGSRATT